MLIHSREFTEENMRCSKMPKDAAAELKAALSLDPKFPGAEEAKKTVAGLK
jgi:hypothetical protein